MSLSTPSHTLLLLNVTRTCFIDASPQLENVNVSSPEGNPNIGDVPLSHCYTYTRAQLSIVPFLVSLRCKQSQNVQKNNSMPTFVRMYMYVYTALLSAAPYVSAVNWHLYLRSNVLTLDVMTSLDASAEKSHCSNDGSIERMLTEANKRLTEANKGLTEVNNRLTEANKSLLK